MKYLAQINIKNNGGCYRFSADSLDEIRAWAKATGKAGDVLTILRNGDKLKNARVITL
jgi:hypothetical protein